MWIRSDDFADDGPIPERNAFGRPDPETHVTFSSNLNPHLTWGDVPDGTRSFVLTMIDIDVPSRGDDVNQDGRTVPADLERVDFTHWLLADIPGDVREIASGHYSTRVSPRGKPGLTGRPVEGVNDYTGWFADDAEMAGTYMGYDGPCPPWNDSIVHRYVFTLSALDIGTTGLAGPFTASDVSEATEGHVLAAASITGTHTLNPDLG
ncbi:MAG: YbhB/YbcL family Raf kinase inhibitor-like protein [Acidimicrobiia bacterium]|nr:YbhB/YbcL family Raf kinase inhibitor-like protein [Acidimicrobiia bacterium]